MPTLFRDIKYGIKLLLKDRSFAATAIFTLAVCIGANTAIFTVIHSVLLKPLPVPDSERIILMSNQYPNAGVGDSSNSGVPDYYDRLRDVKVFDEQAMYRFGGVTIQIDNTPQRVHWMTATPSFFRLVRAKPLIGRAFSDDDGTVGNDNKVILSYGLWRQLYAGDPNAIGKILPTGSGPQYTIVGVMPPDFLFVDPEVRLWKPIAFTNQDKSDSQRHSNSYNNIGRLKPGATIEQAKAQVDALNAANLERFPQWKQLLLNAGFFTRVERLQDKLVDGVRPMLYLLWGGAIFVLLIGAVNITNLALARSSVRLKEMATRLALGAARIRLTRQLITESLIVTIIGGVLGLGVGAAILRLLSTIGLKLLPRASEVRMDGAVIAFTLAISVVVGVLIGMVGVAQLLKLNVGSVLHEEGRTGTVGRKTRFVRRSLVVTQVAIAFVLLIGAGLLLASFRRLLEVDPGFRAEGVVTAATNAPPSRYPGDPELRAFMTRALAAFRQIPGVRFVGASTNVPFDGDSSDSVILAEGYTMQPGESVISPRNMSVTPDYFETMGIPLVKGRYFEDRDNETALPAIIVDQTLARRFWGDTNPIGRRMYKPQDPNDLLKVDEHTKWLTVVGVVHDVRMDDLSGNSNKAGAYYFPFAQQPFRSGMFTVKTAADNPATIEAVRKQFLTVDRELPLFEVHTMNEMTAQSLMPRRAAMLLALGFGAVAMFLAAIGIYGVLAYVVAQRMREIGIRMALGSSASDIFKMVLQEGLLIVAIGLGIGLAGAFSLRHVIESQIFGVRPFDPLVVGTALATIGAIAFVACALPARRATRVDPVIILNQ